ncbi:unnamed protein product [Rhizophagus irregularis]|nr:unnamed protein product [Rhizophagus irregularis]
MAPEVLRGHQYTQAADIYSFGIMMNELMSEEIAFNDIPHDQPVNSTDYLSSFQEPVSSTSVNPISERLNYFNQNDDE